MRLLVRADDAGLCDAVNTAIVESVELGIARNVSVMVPTPRFAAAAALLRDLPGIAVGLHTTLTSEWEAPRWGPVLPADRVRSLVDTDGCFLRSPDELAARRRPNADEMDVEEAVAEVAAQLAEARRAGLTVSYLDEHMGVGRLSELREALTELAHREGLVYEGDSRVARLAAELDPSDPSAALAERIRTSADGTHVLVTHPGCDSDELRAIHGVGFERPGEVARAREADRRALVSADVRRACLERGVDLIRYPDLARPGG
jgi:predicted glycoside hydrolase/deacetylase ChbG (UPF0249 family)